MDYVHDMGLDRIITNTTRRNLELDWGMPAQNERLLKDIGANDPTRWAKLLKTNWFKAAMVALSQPIGAVRQPAKA